MMLRFTKMHGAGNDFIVIDGIGQSLRFGPAQWRRLADRHFGVGADQILVVERTQRADADFRYRIFNADGNEVEQCGNGARCFARFVIDRGLTGRRTLRVETLGGMIEPTLEDDGRVRVDMGVPMFDPASVPFDAKALEPRRVGDDVLWPLDVDGAVRWVSVVSMGNPHAVQIVDDIAAAPVRSEGPRIEHSARFPKRVNAGYLQVLSPTIARLRVWERGAGETLSCGTGACAAAVVAMRQQVMRSPVDIETRGGRLSIAWDGSRVQMTGPAVTVFDGEIDAATLFPTEPE